MPSEETLQREAEMAERFAKADRTQAELGINLQGHQLGRPSRIRKAEQRAQYKIFARFASKGKKR